MSNIYNLEHEKNFIRAVIRNHQLIDEYAHIISERDFSRIHRPIYQAVRKIKREKGECNKLLLIETLKACGQKIGDEVDPDIYINSLDLIEIPAESVSSIAKELANKTIQRELNETAKTIFEKTQTKETKNGLELLNEVTEIFNRSVNVLDSVRKDEPRDIFESAEEHIEVLGNNPKLDGAMAPFPIFRDLFGDFSVGDMSFIIARPKAGKSTMLLNILIKAGALAKKNNRRFKALVLDTELEFEREQRRMVSSFSGVGEYWLRTGFWRKNPEMEQKVRAVWKTIKPLFGCIDHIYVGGKSLAETLSIVRRWHGKNVGLNDDTDTIVCLDYVKLGSADNLAGNTKDYQLVGQKVDAHKILATQLRYHCLTAGQSNRLNEGRTNESLISDGRAVGLSDQISQFASNIYLLQLLTLPQIAIFKEIATHSLIPLYTRNQGPQSQGFNSLVKYDDEEGKVRYADNFLLFKFENFDVTEITDFKSWTKKNAVKSIDLSQTGETSEESLPI